MVASFCNIAASIRFFFARSRAACDSILKAYWASVRWVFTVFTAFFDITVVDVVG